MCLGLTLFRVKNKLSKFVNSKLFFYIPLDACLHSTPFISSKILGIAIFYLAIIIMTEYQLHSRCNSSNTKMNDMENGIALRNVSLSGMQMNFTNNCLLQNVWITNRKTLLKLVPNGKIFSKIVLVMLCCSVTYFKITKAKCSCFERGKRKGRLCSWDFRWAKS